MYVIIINLNMQTLLACLCCCCDFKEQTPVIEQKPAGQKKRKKSVASKQTRLKTKYTKVDFKEVS
jgi:hypothetical protein